jgi:protein phosphatase
MLTAVTKTDPGKVRSNNEDLALADPGMGLLALADGMGGHNAGEVASRIAIDAAYAFLRETAPIAPADWPFGFDEAASMAANRIRTALMLANRDVFQTAEKRPEYEGMGTTLTAAIVEGARATVMSIGDSRLYLFRGSALKLVTRDESLVSALAEVGGLDPKALENHPMRNLLTNVIGKRANLEGTIDELPLQGGDVLVLSSDGMHGALPVDAIESILKAEPDIERVADLLVRTALEADGRDNITVVVARYTAEAEG